ncbi:hypothetical protein SHKM778_09520 [Streptomyces sp. KM77-8]|uniref:EcoEI R protein C-terminal domain-containing protein n=1 Tax=Streptomyces haneummycinicus TaxID=3074435 RepID=A0AAT9HAX8_9ACTN
MKKLLDKTGTLALSSDEAETLARRLARVDRQLTDDERRRIEEVTGDGTTLTSLARRLADAVDVDRQDAALRTGGEQAARKLVTDAIAPLTGNPELRKLIVEIRHQQDLTYDETTAVAVTEVVEVDRAERARKELKDWHEVLTKAERDCHAAVQVALGSGSGNRSVAEKRAALRELEGKIKSGPRAWTPSILWGHYEQLGRAAAHPGREAGLGDLMALIRYELGADDQLQPYRNVVEERFQGWLLRQKQAGVEFTEEQLWWLKRIRDVIASDVGIESPELNVEPFTAHGVAGLYGHVRRKDQGAGTVGRTEPGTGLSGTEFSEGDGLPDGWVRVRLGDVLDAIEAGKSFTCEPRPAEPEEWGIVKVSAMTYGSFDEAENKAVPAGAAVNPTYEISPGDVLVSRANTKAYVGAPVLVGDCRPRLLLSDKSLRLVPNRAVDKRWLVYALRSPKFGLISKIRPRVRRIPCGTFRRVF